MHLSSNQASFFENCTTTCRVPSVTVIACNLRRWPFRPTCIYDRFGGNVKCLQMLGSMCFWVYKYHSSFTSTLRDRFRTKSKEWECKSPVWTFTNWFRFIKIWAIMKWYTGTCSCGKYFKFGVTKSFIWEFFQESLRVEKFIEWAYFEVEISTSKLHNSASFEENHN